MMMAAATWRTRPRRLQKVLAQKRVAARENLRARIKRGIEEGRAAGTDAAALADFYSTIMTGMSLQARTARRAGVSSRPCTGDVGFSPGGTQAQREGQGPWRPERRGKVGRNMT